MDIDMNSLSMLILILTFLYMIGQIAEVLFEIFTFLILVYCILLSFNGNITLNQIFSFYKTFNFLTIKEKLISLINKI